MGHLNCIIPLHITYCNIKNVFRCIPSNGSIIDISISLLSQHKFSVNSLSQIKT